MKYVDIKTSSQEDDKTDKENYRPTSILPNVRKLYERIFSELQCGFRKGFNV